MVCSARNVHIFHGGSKASSDLEAPLKLKVKKDFKRSQQKPRNKSQTRQSALKEDVDKLTGTSSRDGRFNLDSEEDLHGLTQQLVSKASQVDVMVRSVPQSKVEQLVLDLHNCGFPPSHILSLLSSQPAYLLSQRNLLPNVHLLLTHGLDLSQVMLVLHSFPPIAKMSASQISQAVEALRDGNFEEKSVAQVLAENPGVLLVSKAALGGRVMALRELFTTADVLRLAVDCPQILTDPWEEIQVKFDYVFHDMKITQKQMVYACLFSHSLAHVKTRHAFLVRAGLFDMSKRREGEKSPNARLDQIIDTPDDVFCRKFGGIGIGEYRAFCELYSKELERVQDSDSDDDVSHV